MKALRTAAFVVGAAALIATGVGAAVGAGLLAAGTIGASAATLTAIGAGLSAAAGVLSIAAMAAAPKGTLGGNATKFKIDKEAGIPVVIGRSYTGGNVVHRQYYNRPGSKAKNQAESWVTILSLGVVHSVGPLLIDKLPVPFNASGAALGSYAGNMWLATQKGACPEAAALAGPFGPFPGWNGASKLSGLAADIWTLDFDTKGEKFPNGVPDRGRVVEGVLVYDPRKDSTYPGGMGTCRLGQPDTYVYSTNPGPHAITWAYGHYQNGVLMAGGGLPATGLDLAPFVEWSNVCDANGWTVGGVVYATTDDAWDVLKMICQAGSAEPLPVGAQLSVAFSAPRVSIGTITSNDIMGDVDVPATVSRRMRRNTIIPSVRLETHGWEVVPLDPVVVLDYVAIDGGSRPKEVVYPLIQNAKQGAQIALYEMLNARELDGIVVPAKVYALGYRPGDCITLQVPEANLIGREVVVRQREIDGGTMGATLTCRTETKAKHDFALGKTGTPPPTPDLSNPGIDRSPPDADDWSVAGTTLTADGVSTPALVITGHADRISADEVIFDYRPYIAGSAPDVGWTGASLEPATVTRKEIASVTASTPYEVGVRYRMRGALSDRLILGPVTTGAFAGVGGSGQSAYNVILTNEAQLLPADAAGNITSYAGASTSIQVLYGAQDVTASFEAGYGDLEIRNPQGLSVAGSFPDFYVDGGFDAAEPSATFTFRVQGKAGTEHAGVIIDKAFSLSKSLPGADGSSPPLISMSATSQTFRFNGDGSPAGGDITFSTIRQNAPAAPTFAVIDAKGALRLAFDTAGNQAANYPQYFASTGPDNLTLKANWSAAVIEDNSGGGFTVIAQGTAGVQDRVSVTRVQDGRSAVSTYLTNETFNVPSRADGTYDVFPQADSAGQMRVYDGAVEVTSLCTFTVVNPYHLQTYINADGTYYCTALGGDTGYSYLIASYQGVAYQRTLSAAKTKGAANIKLTASLQTLRTYADGNYYGGQGITFTSTRTGTTQPTYWHLINANGDVAFNGLASDFVAAGPGHWSSPNGDILILSPDGAPANMDYHGGSVGRFSMRATFPDGSLSDTVTIQRIADGAKGNNGTDGTDGVDGADGFSVDTETTNFAQPVFSTGANKPSWTGGSGTIRLNKGGQRITGGVTYAVLNNSGVADLALNGDTFSFSGAFDDVGAFTIRASYGGRDYDKVVAVKKVYDGEAAYKGSFSFGNGGGLSSMVVPAGRQCVISASAQYGISGNSLGSHQQRMSIYWSNKTDGGPANYLGSVDGTVAYRKNNGTPTDPVIENQRGSVSASFAFTAPSPSKEITYIVVMEAIVSQAPASVLGSGGMEVRS